MGGIDLSALGLKPEDFMDRIVDGAVEALLSQRWVDEDDRESTRASEFKQKIEKRITETVERKIDSIFEKYILPNVHTYVNDLVLTETNQWGEKKGVPKTFVEYLVDRANAYIQEDVNYQGKSKSQDHFNWSKSTTRIAFLVHEHIQYSLDRAIKQILQDANNSVAGGLKKAFEMKLEELKASIRVEVSS